ncbi:MAG TPA: ThiF family adenylyltransferase [Lacipirellulaceae bacterium]|jgi:adenylyltransferase/sulfurtransferase|nr:ThiF family adenylyltransferase [Lacipirellulaceae bacterium]
MSEIVPIRYERQARFAPLGDEGQLRLLAGRVLVCGCGALGSVVAETLVRAGVGFVRIVDRDFVELNNLQRQVLYDEQDVADNLPKAIAAANKLRRINSEIEIEPVVADVTHNNVTSLAGDVDLIVDGTDNFATRFLLNDFAVKYRKPWIYGGCIGAEGQTMTIVPGETACLACLIEEAPPPGTTPTCDTAGIIGPIVNVVASIEAAEALKFLSGHGDAISRRLTIIDLWDNQLRHVDLARLRENGDCRVCKQGEFSWLNGQRGDTSAVLCGRNAVQLGAPAGTTVSFDELAARLIGIGRLQRNAFLMRLHVDEYVITVFQDGRTIVGGTNDVAVARSVQARYIGA